MSTYRITNPASGADLGAYYGTTPAAALNAMAKDAGYEDYAACCEDVPAPEGGLRVTEIESVCRSCGSHPCAGARPLCEGCGAAHAAGEPTATAYAV